MWTKSHDGCTKEEIKMGTVNLDLKIMKALSSEVRVAILRQLYNRPMSVSDLFDHKDCDTSRDEWSCGGNSHSSGTEDVKEIYNQTCHREYHFFQSVAP